MLKELFSYIGITLAYLSIAWIVLVSLLGRAFFPEGNLLDIIIQAFK
jgi:hypothetical protein